MLVPLSFRVLRIAESIFSLKPADSATIVLFLVFLYMLYSLTAMSSIRFDTF